MPEPEARSPEAQQRRRRIYMRLRTPAVRQELEKLREENLALSETLNGNAGERTKELQERLVYLAEHRAVLRKELEALTEEQKTLRKARAQE